LVECWSAAHPTSSGGSVRDRRKSQIELFRTVNLLREKFKFPPLFVCFPVPPPPHPLGTCQTKPTYRGGGTVQCTSACVLSSSVYSKTSFNANIQWQHAYPRVSVQISVHFTQCSS
jgi:hypothetical protein